MGEIIDLRKLGTLEPKEPTNEPEEPKEAFTPFDPNKKDSTGIFNLKKVQEELEEEADSEDK